MRINDPTSHRLRVLKAIRRHGPVSRSQLPALTGLSGATISQLSGDLLRRGLILEAKDGPPARPGRPRTNLEINAQGGIVVGASLKFGLLIVAFVDLAGRNLHEVEIAREPYANTTLEGVAGVIADGLQQAIAAAPFSSADISRIGLAIPALVDNDRGVVHHMMTLQPGPFPFADALERRLGLPVTIEHEIVCMARAEHWFGRARDVEDFALIHVGFDIGAARYVGGLPMSGANGFNPEIGHSKTVLDGAARPCFCGESGCLSAYSSIYGILDSAGALAGTRFPAFFNLADELTRVLQQARSGEHEALRLIETAAVHLGMAIGNLITLMDPGTILVMFQDRLLQELVAAPFHAALEKFTMPQILSTNRVVLDTVEEDWRWKGTAALALERTYISPPNGVSQGEG